MSNFYEGRSNEDLKIVIEILSTIQMSRKLTAVTNDLRNVLYVAEWHQ